jgi:signal transduction histidine kinase
VRIGLDLVHVAEHRPASRRVGDENAGEAGANVLGYFGNLWLQVTSNGNGIRLVARDDGIARPAASPSASGLTGMRERLETLGGRLAVRADADSGFTLDAWLPSGTPQPA